MLPRGCSFCACLRHHGDKQRHRGADIPTPANSGRGAPSLVGEAMTPSNSQGSLGTDTRHGIGRDAPAEAERGGGSGGAAPGSGSTSRRRGSVAAAIAGTRRYIRNEGNTSGGGTAGMGRGAVLSGHAATSAGSDNSAGVDLRRRTSRAAVAGLAHATMSPLNHAPQAHVGSGGGNRRPRSRAIQSGDPGFKLGYLGLAHGPDGVSPLRPGLGDGVAADPALGSAAKGLLRSSLGAPAPVRGDPRAVVATISPLKPHLADRHSPAGVQSLGSLQSPAAATFGNGGRQLNATGGTSPATSPIPMDLPGSGEGTAVKSRLPPLQGMLAPSVSTLDATVGAATPSSHAPMSPLTSAVASRRGSRASPSLAIMSPVSSPLNGRVHATTPLAGTVASGRLGQKASPLAGTAAEAVHNSPLTSESDMIAAAFGASPSSRHA